MGASVTRYTSIRTSSARAIAPGSGTALEKPGQPRPVLPFDFSQGSCSEAWFRHEDEIEASQTPIFVVTKDLTQQALRAAPLRRAADTPARGQADARHVPIVLHCHQGKERPVEAEALPQRPPKVGGPLDALRRAEPRIEQPLGLR